jgi:DNA polymerase-4
MDNAGIRTIAHFDLDCFFVSVECLKNKSLLGKPIAVGGNGDRGVVVSCSYEARKFGVRSAMPARQARQLCPELIFVHGDVDSYSQYSREVTQIIADEVPSFEKSSIDEFYIDMTGMDRFFGCARFTKELRHKIISKTGLSISYGLASNKLISKVATNEAKPNGEIAIEHGKEKAFLAPLDIEKLPMVGKKTGIVLRNLGINTIGQLTEFTVEEIADTLGRHGIDLWRKANGMDTSMISPYHEQKSIGTENTFMQDSVDVDFLKRHLVRMTEQVAFELRDNNKLTGCVTVKLRYKDFSTFTKQTVIGYTSADHLLQQVVMNLFESLYNHKDAVRLIGVRFSHLIPGNYQIHLFDDTYESISLYQAIDQIKHKYGEGLLMKAAGKLFTSEKYRSTDAHRETGVVKQVSAFIKPKLHQ